MDRYQTVPQETLTFYKLSSAKIFKRSRWNADNRSTQIKGMRQMPKRKEGGPKKPAKTVPGEAGDLRSKQKADSGESVTNRPSEPEPIAQEPHAPPEPKQQKLVSPYRVVFKSAALGFELGEDSQYRQRVFRFHEKPGDEVIAALKENGFKYRPQEKAWTLQASFASRAVSDNLARQFAEGAIDRPR